MSHPIQSEDLTATLNQLISDATLVLKKIGSTPPPPPVSAVPAKPKPDPKIAIHLYAETRERLEVLRNQVQDLEALQSDALKELAEAIAPQRQFSYRGEDFTICVRGGLYHLRRGSGAPKTELD